MTSWRTYRIPGIYETLEFGTPVILVSPASWTPAIPNSLVSRTPESFFKILKATTPPLRCPRRRGVILKLE